MFFAHTLGDLLMDFAHHGFIFVIGIVAGLSYAAFRVFSRGK